MFYQKMLARSQRLEEEIETKKKMLETFPEGEFFSFKNGKYYKWYHRIGRMKNSVSKDKRSFAEQMSVKKFHSRKLHAMENEKNAIDAYLKEYDTKIEQAEDLLDDTSNYKELLTPYFTSFSKELVDWMNSSYEHNTQNPETLTHKTANGLVVRSKSEAMIAKLLYMNKIPFRYECAIILGEKTFYPDFIIRHPKTGRVIYWEHFGMMDNQKYRARACSKYEHYVMNGIIPSIHLIITYETNNNPFSIEEAEAIIKNYFL